jgi:putative PIN family toxin of toxin-antitoxin system
MTRIVMDTNILVSALLKPESLPAAVLMLAASGEVQLCVSDDVFAEYDDVIRRKHLKRPLDVIEGTLQLIRKQGHWVKPKLSVDECSDPDDNIFLTNVIFPADGRRLR